jgi:hypothetical protein
VGPLALAAVSYLPASFLEGLEKQILGEDLFMSGGSRGSFASAWRMLIREAPSQGGAGAVQRFLPPVVPQWRFEDVWKRCGQLVYDLPGWSISYDVLRLAYLAEFLRFRSEWVHDPIDKRERATRLLRWSSYPSPA